MTTSDKLREILDSNKTRCYDEDYGTMVIKTDSFGDVLSALTALISEDYTANEEVDKMVEERIKKAVEQKKNDIRQWLLDEGYEILSEKI